MSRSDLEPEPHQPVPSHVDISLPVVESAENFISPKPDGEAESEAEFEKNLEAATEPKRQ